jgi:cytochrome oxidase Cu insertion factor (SCO1/SenC/PrrC family)
MNKKIIPIVGVMLFGICLLVILLLSKKSKKTKKKPDPEVTEKSENAPGSTTTGINLQLQQNNPIDTVPCVYNDCFYLIE